LNPEPYIVLKNYLTVAVRNIWRQRFYAFINIFGLALGLAVFMVIALFIRFEFSYDKFHENHGRIYRVEQNMVLNNQIVQDAGLPPPLSKSLIADFPEIEAITRVQDAGSPLLSLGDTKGIISERCFLVDNAFFDIFTFDWVKGNRQTALTEPGSAVVTENVARALFGKAEALGKTIRVDHRYDLNVTGILKNVPANSHLRFDLLISYSSTLATWSKRTLEDWYSNWLPLYVLLHNNHSLAEMNKKIRFALRKHQIGNPYNSELYLKPLTRIHLHSHVKDELGTNGDIQNIYIFSAVALFVLIIACINFVNLVTARAADRAREVGIRKVVGAKRSSLIIQFLGEATLTVIISVFLAMALTELFLPEFNLIMHRNLKIDYLNNWSACLSLIITTILVGVLSGIYPAIFLSSLRPVQMLKGRQSSGTRNIFLRKFLVVFQFFISIVLIIGTVIIIRQVNFLSNKNLGFNRNQILIIHTKNTTPEKNKLFRSQILQHSNVLKVGVSDYLPYNSSNWTGFTWEGAAHNQGIMVNVNYIDEHVLDTYGMVIVDGRGFSKDHLSDQGQAVILNQEAVRQMRMEDPIGKQIYYRVDYRSRDWKGATIVGIVKDFHFLSLHETIGPLMLRFYSDEMTGNHISVKIANQQISKTIEFLQQKFEHIFPRQDFNYRFLDEDFRRMYQEERKTSRIIFYLAILAIFIACLGLFGLASFSIRQRTKEIGIRKALGASVPNIVSYLIAEFLKLLLIANVLAWPAAYLVMNYWLQNFPYRIDIQISVFIIAGVLAVLIALITVLYQALKAASANPVEALRYE
jgi:putative ABC transport system permease protein